MLPTSELQAALVVRHVNKPEWGLGKVIHVDHSHVHVYFKEIVGSPKDAVKALSKELALQLLSRADVQADPALDNLPPMVHGGKVVPPDHVRLTEQQAVDQFVGRWRSFEDAHYLDRERNYKWAAHQLVRAEFLSERGRTLVAAPATDVFAKVLRELIQATNLLAPQEMMALNDAFKDLSAAQKYAAANLKFIDDPRESTFEDLVQVIERLPQAGKARVLSWPIVTLLPYLADPARQMFLKPQMTRETANIFCFDLLYDARPKWSVYARLLVLSDLLLNRLRPLGARDFIDVQSFMWLVVGLANSR